MPNNVIPDYLCADKNDIYPWKILPLGMNKNSYAWLCEQRDNYVERWDQSGSITSRDNRPLRLFRFNLPVKMPWWRRLIWRHILGLPLEIKIIKEKNNEEIYS